MWYTGHERHLSSIKWPVTAHQHNTCFFIAKLSMMVLLIIPAVKCKLKT